MKGAELLKNGFPTRAAASEDLQKINEATRPAFNLQDQKLTSAYSSEIALNQELNQRVNNLLRGFLPGVTGWGTREQMVLSALKGLTPEQMQDLRSLYTERTRGISKDNNIVAGRDLLTDLQKELSGSKLQEALARVDCNTLRADAFELRRNLRSLNAGAEGDIKILLNHQKDLPAFRAEYKAIFKHDFKDEVYKNINGYLAPIARALADGDQERAHKAFEPIAQRYPGLRAAFRETPENAAATLATVTEPAAAHKFADKEQHNGLAATVLTVARAPLARQLHNSTEILERSIALAKADGVITPEEKQALGQKANFVAADSSNFKAEKISLAASYSTAAAALAGSLTPMWVLAPVTGAATKVGTNRVLAGDDYSKHQVLPDLFAGAVAGTVGKGLTEISHAIEKSAVSDNITASVRNTMAGATSSKK